MFRVYAIVAIIWAIYALGKSLKSGERRIPNLFLTFVINLVAAPVCMGLSTLSEDQPKKSEV